jgi:hypothetical protein
MIKSGILFDLIVLLILAGSMAYYWFQTKLPKLRTFAAVEAFPEAVARAVEQNKAVFFSPGDKSEMTSGAYSTQCTASLNLMRYLAELCAKAGARFVAVSPPVDAGMLPAMQAVHREAYLAAGKLDEYRPDDLRYPAPSGGGAKVIATLEILDEVEATSIIMIGAYSNDSMGIQEWGMSRGAMVIGGTVRHMMMFVAAMMAHYVLIADEIYAAGTAVSGDEGMTASLAGTDILKWIMGLIILVGSLLAFAGISLVPLLSI